jgi:uncharacterized membrane protein YdbT with pleckstrin-like domain
MDKLIVVLLAIAASLFISFLMSWPVMMLWNGCLVDAVTGVKEITWLQGWGILILSGILFKETSISFNK